MNQCKTKYTTLLDLSRQAKIITGDTACFNGKIQVGIPFSGYPTGVDLTTVVETGVLDTQFAILSGNTGTTIFDVANPLSPNYSPIFNDPVYSGDSWTNPVFSANTSYLTLPITPLSADTQTTPIEWTLTQTGMTGEYVVGLSYSGYNITYYFYQLEQDTDGAVTGKTTGIQLSYSAQSLDYRGPLDYISSKENISVENRLITNKLQVKNGADASTIGYVLKQSDSEGNVEWGPDTSGSTSSITDYTYDDTNNTLTITLSDGSTETATINEMSGLTINNSLVVRGQCGVGTETPLERLHVVGNILVSNNSGSSVITLSGSSVSDAAVNFDNTGSATPFSQIIGQTFGGGASGNIEFNTNPGAGLTKRMTISNAGRVGIGNINNNDIEEELHVYDGDFLIERSGGRFSTVLNNVSGPLVRLSAATSDTLLSINVSTPNRGGLSMGARGLTDVGFPGYGKVGDGYIYSSNDQNGINIISSAGAGLEDYIRMYAGQDAVGTPDLYIQGTGTTRGFVGIHTDTPTTELDVDGDVNISGSLTVGSQVIGSTTTVNSFTNPNVNANTIFYNAAPAGGTISLMPQLNVTGNRVELIRSSGTGNPILSATGVAPNIINNATTMTLPTTPFSRTTCIYNGTQWFCTNQTP